jgi:hypothetical protein
LADPQLTTVSARRWQILVAVVVVALAVAGVGFWRAARDQQEARKPTAQTKRDTALDLKTVLAAPHILFRSTAQGPTYGLVAAVPLSAPGGLRAVSETQCDRVYARAGTGLCLSADRGAVTTYRADVLDGALKAVRKIDLGGIPNRARVASDGSIMATTSFVAGHSYLDSGFSTETVITDVSGGVNYGNLEKTFTTMIDGKKVTAADLNVWGVTFVPGPKPTRFYATVATGGKFWVAEGDLGTKTLTAIHAGGECPSLSPDGTKIVYKHRISPTAWRLYGYDLAGRQQWELPETRSVDDQVEWLDNEHVTYGLPRAGSAETDIWSSPLREGKPVVLVPDAWSPAVVS